ncbi:MAG: prepilin peptidase [Eubacteriales bacterium]
MGYKVLLLALFGALGFVMGWFLNFVIYKFQKSEKDGDIALTREKASFLSEFLKRKYSFFGKAISVGQFSVCLINSVLWIGCAYFFYGNTLAVVVNSLMVSCLICISYIDAATLLIPDILLAVFGAACLARFIVNGIELWKNAFLGLALMLLLTGIAYIAGRLVYKIQPLGEGDIILMAVSGFALGYQKALLSLLAASLLASGVMFFQNLLERGSGRRHAFAPFISVGVALMLFFGDKLVLAFFGSI